MQIKFFVVGNDVRKSYTAKPKNLCVDCNTEISKSSIRCGGCASIFSQVTKIDWPEMNKLLALLEESSYVAVGKKLGVSDNAIRHHIKSRARQKARKDSKGG